jgi:hypothetical protein
MFTTRHRLLGLCRRLGRLRLGLYKIVRRHCVFRGV